MLFSRGPSHSPSLTPLAYCSQLLARDRQTLHLTKCIQQGQNSSRFVQSFPLTLRTRQLGVINVKWLGQGHSVNGSFATGSQASGPPALALPTQIKMSKAIRVTRATTSRTEAACWRTPAFENKNSRFNGTFYPLDSIWLRRQVPAWMLI